MIWRVAWMPSVPGIHRSINTTGLAAEGRTVFVSSHLMGEMEHCVDRLVVIGRGRLIAEESLAEFAAHAGRSEVVVRTPDPASLVTALATEGATTRCDPDGTLTVTGVTGERIGELALGLRIPLHGLTTRTASLEKAFMALTAADVEYAAGEDR
ncbi:hypothetical protein Vgi01_03770 [Micromonospora gifhornensis]|uniref:ABC-2 type transport system ATP-binding protein n=2 Tax=Micromonospora gifhornensis TaxID=84594 RepID=A0ABQ4I718_9ACTN|nr:hypothetical protein Vgi01_03770 [Micromonospora gifhornensis]